jgi:hypothetical protein
MDKHQRYRLKDLEGYRKRKREYARTPDERAKRTAYMRGWREKNRERHNELCLQSYHRRKDDPARKAAKDRAHLKYKYGLTPEDYDAKLAEQGGVCAICGKSPTKRRLHIDHCHETGRIRGLLCTGCNTRLGWYEAFNAEVVAYLR